MEKKNYVSPEFLVEELRAEFGFAISGGQKMTLMITKN